ncbi:hypothetical protein BB561_002880 [Smittium simulii]|uniref:Extracellular membrane protein CFEM domain-containing protein n=1 Tax=Smittium simulii TaxID=133385 RepID=A0A2T9YNU1_9FUNG|nr:hypothetical protein BB561_002880 [Smittium simulii]
MNSFFKLLFFVALLFAYSSNAECEGQENFKACATYITSNKDLYCNATDYECHCSWDTHLVTCFSICPNDDSKSKALMAAQKAQNRTCDAFLEWTNAVIKPNGSLLKDDEDDENKSTTGVDNSKRVRKGDEKLNVAKSASSSASTQALFTFAAFAAVVLTIIV